jgi:hypothetical protein
MFRKQGQLLLHLFRLKVPMNKYKDLFRLKEQHLRYLLMRHCTKRSSVLWLLLEQLVV